ncbi:MAG: phosphatase [Actinomycetales bacterium]|nr:MAG: phosphatase [Actinomycetales bacterium]
MDGTLVNSIAAVSKAWGDFAVEHGLDPVAVLDHAHGRPTIDTITKFMPERTDDERAALVDELLENEISRTVGIVEIPGARALMDAIFASGIPVALVTSATEALMRSRMAAAGLVVPDVIVCDGDVTNGKPAPDAYLRAAELLGIPASECVILEDSAAGIAAAQAAGVAGTILVGETDPTDQNLFAIPDLRGLEIS